MLRWAEEEMAKRWYWKNGVFVMNRIKWGSLQLQRWNALGSRFTFGISLRIESISLVFFFVHKRTHWHAINSAIANIIWCLGIRLIFRVVTLSSARVRGRRRLLSEVFCFSFFVVIITRDTSTNSTGVTYSGRAESDGVRLVLNLIVSQNTSTQKHTYEYTRHG